MNRLLLYYSDLNEYLYESNLNGNINIILHIQFNYYFMCLGKERPKTELYIISIVKRCCVFIISNVSLVN